MRFRAYVGSKAPENPTLLYAVLAVAARHRSLRNGIDDVRADDYQRRCLETLTLALNNTEETLNETILMASLVLRFLEEMTGM